MVFPRTHLKPELAPQQFQPLPQMARSEQIHFKSQFHLPPD
jgi:hypothetical protein